MEFGSIATSMGIKKYQDLVLKISKEKIGRINSFFKKTVHMYWLIVLIWKCHHCPDAPDRFQ